MTSWDDSIIPNRIPQSLADEGPDGEDGFTPLFVNIDSLANIDKSEPEITRLWDGETRPDFELEYDGSLEIAVGSYGFISKIQVVNIRSKEAWEHEWRYKNKDYRNMFVPCEFGDILLARTHVVGEAHVTEHYLSSMHLSVDFCLDRFDMFFADGSQPSSEGGSFQVRSENGKPVTGAVLMDEDQQVLGRTDETGMLHWHKLELDENQRKVFGNAGRVDREAVDVRYPAVLWKYGHVPVVFDESHPLNKTIPTSGTVKIGPRSLFVTADLPGAATLSNHERCGTTTIYRPWVVGVSEIDLLPVPDAIELTNPEQIGPFLGYSPDYCHITHDGLSFPGWNSRWVDRDESIRGDHIRTPELEIPGFPRDSFQVLENWYFQHWFIDNSGRLTVELPVAGKYLLKIGSFHDVARELDSIGSESHDARYGSASHLVYIDARDPENPVFTLIDRPEKR